MIEHLDQKLYDQLLAGQLNETQEGRLLLHLREDCAECEDFMAKLDGEKLWTLMNIIDRTAEPEVPKKMRKIPSGFWGFFRKKPALVPAFGFAMLLVIALSLVLFHFTVWDEADTVRTKGIGELISGHPVELTVGTVSGTSGQTRVERIKNGGTVALDQRLTFRIDTHGPCYLYLACISGESMEILSPTPGSTSAYHAGGTFIPGPKGRPAAMSMKGYTGRLRFIAACAAQALLIPEEDLMRLGTSARLPSRSPANVESCDVVDVFVSPKAGAL